MKMWSGRISGPLDPGFERWQRSFGFDRRLFEAETHVTHGETTLKQALEERKRIRRAGWWN